MKDRNDTANDCDKHNARIGRNTNKKIRMLQPDNGAELLPFKTGLDEIGVYLTTAFAYKPDSKGLAALTNRTVLSNWRAAISEASLVRQFSGEG